MEYLDVCSACASKFLSCGVRDVTQRALCLVFVLSILLHGQAVRSATAEDDEPQVTITHRINENKDAELICTVKDLGSRRIIWSKLSDPYPISIGTTRFMPNKRYRVEGKSREAVMLTIKRVTSQDAGEYQCRVSGLEYLAEIISLNIPSGSDSTRLVPTETEVMAEVGDTVLLPCHVENLNTRLVLWKDDRNEVVSLRKKIYNGDRRFDVVHGSRTEWSLQLRDVKPSDFGHYTCIVNSRPVLTRTVALKNSAPVEMAPVLKRDTNYRMKVEADPGETVTLTCNFRANPPATVTWYKREVVGGKNTNQKVGVGSSLTLQSVTTAQSGKYICISKNGIKPSGRGRTRLIVKVPPTTVPPTTVPTTFVPTGPSSPHLYHHGKVTKQRRGSNVEIQCTAIGQPRPQIHWRRHGHRVENDHKYRVSSKNSGRHTITSTLLIRSLSSRDFGEYECVGYNALGLSQIAMEVTEEA